MASVQDIQRALKEAGFDPGPIDGIRGRLTIAAIKRFQEAHGLDADGIVGPKTAEKLLGQAEAEDAFTIPHTLPWLQEAYQLIGTKEEPGAGSNEAIIGWSKPLRIDYDKDETPWCGLFVAHCVGSQLTEEAMPAKPLVARNWRTFGNACSPELGSIMVFWRGSPTGWKGHVGFYWAEDSHTYHILGGNQGDAVNIKRFKKERFLEARWPMTALDPTGLVRHATARGRLLSDNEQ